LSALDLLASLAGILLPSVTFVLYGVQVLDFLASSDIATLSTLRMRLFRRLALSNRAFAAFYDLLENPESNFVDLNPSERRGYYILSLAPRVGQPGRTNRT
jgi:hypothetical protein